MVDYDAITRLINATVFENGEGKITGIDTNSLLKKMLDATKNEGDDFRLVEQELERRIGENVLLINANKSEIDSNKGKIAQNTVDIQNNANEITQARIDIDGNAESITNVDGKVDANTREIERVEGKVDTNSDAISTNTQEIAKKLNITDAVGKKTAEGGEIFNSATSASSNAHAEGIGTMANGSASHAEGARCETSSSYAHAEGFETKAKREAAHSEGKSSEAIGIASHAEGELTNSGGFASHTEGSHTKATNPVEHAQGKWNKSNGGLDYTVDSIGIGSSDTDRKNANETLRSGKHFILNVGDYDGTNSVKPNTQGIKAQDLASFLNNGGALIEYLKGFGFTYDNSDGKFELNGVKMDINEAGTVVSEGYLEYALESKNMGGSRKAITNLGFSFPSGSGKVWNLKDKLSPLISMKAVRLGETNDTITKIVEITSCFNYAPSLERVIGILDVERCNSFDYVFGIAPKVKYVRFKGLKVDFNLVGCKSFDVSDDAENGSLAYMIANSANDGSPITITLHPTAFAMVSDNLKQKAIARNITIKSA